MKNFISILVSVFFISNAYSQVTEKINKESNQSHEIRLNDKASSFKSKEGNKEKKSNGSHAQVQLTSIPTLTNEPFEGEPCASGYLDEHLRKTDPIYRNNRIAIENQVQQFSASRSGNSRGVVYTIPVVFHVLHSGELLGDSTNISYAQIESAIAALNRDFRRDSTLDGGIANSGPLGVDAEIEFCLAKKDPNGLYTTGVTRHDMSSTQGYLDSGVYHTPSLWRSDVGVKSLVQWNPAQYMNVWIVNKIKNTGNIYTPGYGGGVIGYAYFPGGTPANDGIVILSSAVGSDPTGILNYNLASYTNDGRTLTHEVGHYLNLYHTFQSTTSCTPGTPCSTSGDYCCDTPPTTVGMGNNCTSPVCPTANLENYMDYQNGACASDFTPNQVTRMRSVLVSGGARSALVQTNNCTPPAAPSSSYCLDINAIDYTSAYLSSTPLYGYTNPIFPDSNVLINWSSGLTPPWLHGVCQTFDLSGGYLNNSGGLFDPAVRSYSVTDTITIDSITIRGYYGRPNNTVVDTAIIRVVLKEKGNYKRAYNISSLDSIIYVVDDVNKDNEADSSIWTGKIVLDSAFKSDSLSYGANLFKIAPNLSIHDFDGLLGVTVEFKPGNNYSQATDTIFKNQNYINVIFATPLGSGTDFPIGLTGNSERTSGSFSDDNTKYGAGSSFDYYLPPIAFTTDHSYQLYDITLKICKDSVVLVEKDTIHVTPMCDSSLVGGVWYYSNQTLIDTVFRSDGNIDSLTYIIIPVNHSSSAMVTQSSCDSFVTVTGKLITTSGVYYDTIPNIGGCDSIITYNISVNVSSIATDVQSACGTFTWIDGNTYVASNSLATHTLTNAMGCDSIVTLNLTILPTPDITVTQLLDTLKSNQNGATYQWIDCGNGNLPISGATNQEFVSVSSGSYAAVVTLGTCFDTTACITVAKVGVGEVSNSTLFSIFPNPTNGNFNVSFNEVKVHVITVRNSLGQEMTRLQTAKQNQEVSLSNYPNGLYLITISNETESRTVRIIKN